MVTAPTRIGLTARRAQAVGWQVPDTAEPVDAPVIRWVAAFHGLEGPLLTLGHASSYGGPAGSFHRLNVTSLSALSIIYMGERAGPRKLMFSVAGYRVLRRGRYNSSSF